MNLADDIDKALHEDANRRCLDPKTQALDRRERLIIDAIDRKFAAEGRKGSLSGLTTRDLDQIHSHHRHDPE